MKKPTQVIIIHGGTTFRSHSDYLHYLQTRSISLESRESWTGTFLSDALGKQCSVIRPRMPRKEDAKYAEWKIHFERYLPLLNDNVILIGVSLGGIFLAKYLAENAFPTSILATYLICPPYDNSISGEDLVGGFRLPKDLSLLEKSSKNLYLMFSADDEIVPIAHAKKYQKKLSRADIIIFESKNGHFFISDFPEIVQMIQADIKELHASPI